MLADTAEEIIPAIPEEKRVVDPVAVLELLQVEYIAGNRTMVQGVQRMPWRATLNGDGTVERRPPLHHSKRLLKAREIARTLRARLEEELFEAAKDRARVFVMLSGGLDSRIVAGVLKRLEPQLQSSIRCVTWGEPKSRDVVYAQRIANWYDWELIHVPYDAPRTWANIERGAVWGGSEVAGLHLHGMEWFRNARPDDLAIAASFGDSIGRAEFSRRHLSILRPHLMQNKLGLMHPGLVNRCLPLAERDRRTAWEGESEAPDWVRYELDMQENYMRRMICHAMDYVRQFCSLHQAFTSDAIVSYMWSLRPDCRTDDVYRELLRDLDSKLYSLPWARTGVALDGTVESDSSLRQEYHDWDRWLRQDLRDRLQPLVLSTGLRELGAFYWPAVHRVWNKWSRRSGGSFARRATLVHLASLELSRRHFSLRPCRCRSRGWLGAVADASRHHLGMPARVSRRVLSRSLVLHKRLMVQVLRQQPR